MRDANTSLTNTILRFCTVVEVGTGLALLAAPELVIRLLLGELATPVSVQTGRVAGIALVALGLACWPDRPRGEPMSSAGRAMLTYNVLVALFLTTLYFFQRTGGVLLWPAIALHAAVAALLFVTRRRG